MSRDAYYDKLMKMNSENRYNIIIEKLTEINKLIYTDKNNINSYLVNIAILVNVINHSLILQNEPIFIKSMYTIMTELIKITFALKNDKNVNSENYTYTYIHRYENIIINILKIFLYYTNKKISYDFMYKVYYFIIKLSETPERECIIFNLVILINNIISCDNYLSIFTTSKLKERIELCYNNVIIHDTKNIIEITINKLINSHSQFIDGQSTVSTVSTVNKSHVIMNIL